MIKKLGLVTDYVYVNTDDVGSKFNQVQIFERRGAEGQESPKLFVFKPTDEKNQRLHKKSKNQSSISIRKGDMKVILLILNKRLHVPRLTLVSTTLHSIENCMSPASPI